MNTQPFSPPRGAVLYPMHPVESSHLSQAGYDIPTKTLQVAFTRTPGKIYQYYGVAQGTYVAMKAAKSVGSFFNSNVKGKHSGQRVK